MPCATWLHLPSSMQVCGRPPPPDQTYSGGELQGRLQDISLDHGVVKQNCIWALFSKTIEIDGDSKSSRNGERTPGCAVFVS